MIPTAYEATFLQAVAGAFIFGTLINMLRYFFMAGSVYKFFYKWWPRRFAHRRILGRPRKADQNRRDIGYSMLSMGIFGVTTLGSIYLIKSGATQLYTDVDQHGWGYWAFSIALMLVIHDTWFYWTHRLMHSRLLFKHVHRVHHQSTDPTPLTSYAFHPLEALVEAGIGPVIILLLPVHHSAMFIFITIQYSQNILGHLGYELYPRWFTKTPLRYILSTTTHHHQHHQKFTSNFALYFNVWDRLMGTNHPDYDVTLAKQTGATVPAERDGMSSETPLPA